MSDITDPIDGLVKFIEEIKPFHSKVIEVLTEYVYTEQINITVSESSSIDVGISINNSSLLDDSGDITANAYGGNYATDPYDSAEYFPVIAFNTTQTDGAFTAGNKKGYDASQNRVIVPGNQTATYRVGRQVIVDLIRFNTETQEEEIIDKDSESYEIVSATYVSLGQTNGITDTAHTEIVLDGLIDETGLTLGANEIWTANVRLTPETLKRVVLSVGSGSNTFRYEYDTIPMFGPGEVANEFYYQSPEAQEPTEHKDGKITTFNNYVVLEGDTTGSYPYGSSLIMSLADGSRNVFTAILSVYDEDTNETRIDLLEALELDASYTGAQVVEGFFGYATQYVIPSAASQSISEGVTQTNISEAITFSWNDGTDEVIDGTQFLIKEIREVNGENTIIVVENNRDITQFIEENDMINIIEADPSNNGRHSVKTIEVGIGEVLITTYSNLNISDNVGFLETT